MVSKQKTARKTNTTHQARSVTPEDVPYELDYQTESGFDLSITPLPPYYLDIIEDLYPFLEYPKREIILHAGDVVYQPYNPPDEEPDRDHPDYDIFQQWHDVDRHNDEVKTKRARMKRDLLLSMCVEIKGGPVDVDDPVWISNLEAPFGDVGFEVPTHAGKRKLMFLKYFVIRNSVEAAELVQMAMYKEVTIQGISTALRGFQSDVGRNSDRESDS